MKLRLVGINSSMGINDMRESFDINGQILRTWTVNCVIDTQSHKHA